ncbi:MAG: 3,4-dihydroxy-2-butanone-4-phosphate synthase [Deltaproteobacteria bacterium]|nr:3,4-dihydroxy-2-butanone-4-phosphate synthase [Deltaproteobacteria bacterium]
MSLATTAELIEEIKLGKMIVLIDDEDRENEGDLVLAADFVNARAINFMITKARGLVCLAMHPDQIDRLKLPLMQSEEHSHSSNKTGFTLSIEAATGVTTGISASDRAWTIKVASNPLAKSTDVHIPGHVFPIRAKKGGVLERPGHTEGSVDLAILAGLNPSAVICEIMNEDGSMARVPELKKFSQFYGLKMGSIKDLIDFKKSK